MRTWQTSSCAFFFWGHFEAHQLRDEHEKGAVIELDGWVAAT